MRLEQLNRGKQLDSDEKSIQQPFIAYVSVGKQSNFACLSQFIYTMKSINSSTTDLGLSHVASVKQRDEY